MSSRWQLPRCWLSWLCWSRQTRRINLLRYASLAEGARPRAGESLPIQPPTSLSISALKVIDVGPAALQALVLVHSAVLADPSRRLVAFPFRSSCAARALKPATVSIRKTKTTTVKGTVTVVKKTTVGTATRTTTSTKTAKRLLARQAEPADVLGNIDALLDLDAPADLSRRHLCPICPANSGVVSPYGKNNGGAAVTLCCPRRKTTTKTKFVTTTKKTGKVTAYKTSSVTAIKTITAVVGTFSPRSYRPHRNNVD